MTPPADVASIALVSSSSSPNVDSEGAAALDPAVDTLEAGDVLWYAGNANAIATIRKIPGLAPYATDQVDKLNANSQERRLIQAVVAKTGPLVGKSIRDIKFRSRYNAVVLAVHREGVRVHARIGDVVLHPGDVLLPRRGTRLSQGSRPFRKRVRARVRPRGLRATSSSSTGSRAGHRGGHDRVLHSWESPSSSSRRYSPPES
jgi:hypothetical protein